MRAFLIAALCLAPRIASADLIRDLRLEGTYAKVGVETGVAFGGNREASPLAGVCATLVHMNDDLEWAGIQADFVVDWNGDEKAGGRWSIGPEAGVSIYGVDLSYFGRRIDMGTHHGLQIRAKLTVGVAAVYFRAAHTLVGADETTFDIGLQVKTPVWARRKHARVAARSTP